LREKSSRQNAQKITDKFLLIVQNAEIPAAASVGGRTIIPHLFGAVNRQFAQKNKGILVKFP